MKEFWKNFDYTWSGNFSDQKSPFFQWENDQNGPKWPKHGIPKMAIKGQKCPKNALKCVKNVLKMVEAATVCPGKVRACPQKVRRAACERGVTASPEKYVFERFCPFLPVLGRFWTEFGHFAPKCPKSPLKKGTFLVRKIS